MSAVARTSVVRQVWCPLVGVPSHPPHVIGTTSTHVISNSGSGASGARFVALRMLSAIPAPIHWIATDTWPATGNAVDCASVPRTTAFGTGVVPPPLLPMHARNAAASAATANDHVLVMESPPGSGARISYTDREGSGACTPGVRLAAAPARGARAPAAAQDALQSPCP